MTESRQYFSSSESVGLWHLVHRSRKYYANCTTKTTAHYDNNTVVIFLKIVRYLLVVVTTVAARVHGTVVSFPSA